MNGFENISNEEMLEVDGGFWVTAAVIIGVVTGGAYIVGAYKGSKN
ncbi:class IIb bacteriocin, lactobin A/cerein 7B family [Lachnospira multipara]|uniref:Class IIb bacteriocin, lactobin A/cerein 7B family n=1 Tax=Lachnospira multipara TaxID=28051 RepID=A0A1H5UZ18_9FIRM|nr:class IIb bacteriocin, lactobin A/cerein 7B family [Lachnospira multipara]SEF80210.1 class IIb bacteriocin, lactobin A/cerein 7B family [Lachnospira multipara]